jgi:hypothetical protein
VQDAALAGTLQAPTTAFFTELGAAVARQGR